MLQWGGHEILVCPQGSDVELMLTPAERDARGVARDLRDLGTQLRLAIEHRGGEADPRQLLISLVEDLVAAAERLEEHL